MTLVVLLVVAVVIVIAGGLIIFSLMKRAQTVVPDVSDEHAATTDRVVAEDDQSRPVTESQDGPSAPHSDTAGFEKVLGESLEQLRPEREE